MSSCVTESVCVSTVPGMYSMRKYSENCNTKYTSSIYDHEVFSTVSVYQV